MKNFSLIETQQGYFKLSPAYDLLNTKIHFDDSDFALKDGLLPKSISKGKIREQFLSFGKLAEIPDKTVLKVLSELTSKNAEVEKLISQSFLSEKLQRNYLQSFQGKLKKLTTYTS